MAVIKLNKDNFDSITNTDKKVLVDFYADWCGPCRMMAPIVDEIAGERDDVVVCKINVDEEPELAQRFEVMSIPTLVILKDSKELSRSVGARPKAQLISLLNG